MYEPRIYLFYIVRVMPTNKFKIELKFGAHSYKLEIELKFGAHSYKLKIERSSTFFGLEAVNEKRSPAQ